MKRVGAWVFNRPYLLLTITMLCWAGNAIVGRGVRGDIPPVSLACIRWSGALLIILPFALPHIRRDWPVLRAHLPVMILLGVLGIGCFNTMLYTGLQYTSALNGALLQSANPIVIALAVLVLFREVPRWFQVIGISISLAGVLVVIAQADWAILSTLAFNVGDVWIVAAVLIWAVYTALLRLRPPVHWLTFLASTFTIGLVFLLPFLVWEHARGREIELSSSAIAASAYVMLFPSLVAYISYNRAVELAGSTIAGAFHHLIPIFTATLAFVFLGEAPKLFHAIGFALVIAGVTLASRKTR